MIYTSYFAQMRNFPKNYIPVAICGGLPNWYKGKWYCKPAPKIGFFQEWKRTGDNEYYIEHYQKEVLDLLDYQKVLVDLQMQVPEEIRATMQELKLKSSKRRSYEESNNRIFLRYLRRAD